MSGFPTVNFGQPENGLFSPEEIRRLMEAEVQRAQRYDYPLTLALIEIDRLESLHDLYGVESQQRIVGSVVGLLRSTTRASDVLGTLRDERMLVLFPHTSRAVAVAIARRLLAGCRELEFRGDGRSLRASLSIGLAQRTPEADLARLSEAAERALLVALAAGGDRFLEYEGLPRREAQPGRVAPAEVPAAMPARARANPAPGSPVLPAVRDLPGSSLEEKVQSLFGLIGGSAGLGGLEREVLDILRRTVADAGGARASRADVQREVEVLEARIAKLKGLLGASEEELALMIQEKSADPGIASVYRSVQGLDPATRNFARKRELLGVIYQANLELLRQLKGEPG